MACLFCQLSLRLRGSGASGGARSHGNGVIRERPQALRSRSTILRDTPVSSVGELPGRIVGNNISCNQDGGSLILLAIVVILEQDASRNDCPRRQGDAEKSGDRQPHRPAEKFRNNGDGYLAITLHVTCDLLFGWIVRLWALLMIRLRCGGGRRRGLNRRCGRLCWLQKRFIHSSVVQSAGKKPAHQGSCQSAHNFALFA